MFRIISDRGAAGPAVLPADASPDAGGVAVLDDVIPFVEVGGPEGVVMSGLPDAPRRATAVEREPTPVPAPAAAPPSPEPASVAPPRVLSVAFHRLPKLGLRLVPNGVSADLVTYHFPDHEVSREYAAVRDEVRRQFEAGGPRAVGFTAAAAESGATTVLLNLAASLAAGAGPKVLAVDANFARPAVAARLGAADAPGLAEVLGQSTPLAWAVQPTAVANLHALSAGRAGAGIAAAMAADFPRLLGQLRQWFDWVLVDVGVWAEAGGREAVGPACDAVYLVSRQADLDRPAFTGLRAAVAAAGGVARGYVTTRE